MNNRHFISLRSTQTINNDSQSENFKFPCRYSIENGIIQICYEEYSKSDYGKIYFSKIEFCDNGIAKIKREGKEKINLTLEKDKYHKGYYSTPFGDIVLDVFTKDIIFKISEDGCFAKLIYILHLDGEVLSENKILIRVKEKIHV